MVEIGDVGFRYAWNVLFREREIDGRYTCMPSANAYTYVYFQIAGV
jgi:hypothetical protein